MERTWIIFKPVSEKSKTVFFKCLSPLDYIFDAGPTNSGGSMSSFARYKNSKISWTINERINAIMIVRDHLSGEWR